MPEFTTTEVAPRPYLYVEGRTTLDPGAVSRAMGRAFETVIAFLDAHGISIDGPPLSVYDGYSPEEVVFRAGMFVGEDDVKAAAAR